MNQKVSWLASIMLVLSYVVFSLLAVSHFPGSFTPLNHWLSDLGSNELNPAGSVFYNIGIISGGIFCVVFFLGLSTWIKIDKKIQMVMIYLSQICGVLGGLSMILSGVFPINAKEIHSFLSAILYIFLGTAFAFTLFALRYYSKFPKWLLALGFLTVIVNLVWSVILNIYPLEWATVVLFLIYILMLGVTTRNRDRYLDHQVKN